jgi:hypothetical protein
MEYNLDHSIGDATAGPDRTTGGVSRLAGLTFGTDEDSFHSQDLEHPQPPLPSSRHANKKKKTTSKNLSSEEKTIINTHPDDPDQTQDTDGMMNELDSYINPKHTRKSNFQLNNNQIRTRQQPLPPASQSRTNPNQYLTTITRQSQNHANITQQDDSFLNDPAAFIISPHTSPEASRLARYNSSDNPRKPLPGQRIFNSGDPPRGGGNHLTLREQEKASHLFPLTILLCR